MFGTCGAHFLFWTPLTLWLAGIQAPKLPKFSPDFFLRKSRPLGGGEFTPQTRRPSIAWLNQMEIFALTKQTPLCAKSQKARVIGRLNGFAKSPFSEKCGFPGEFTPKSRFTPLFFFAFHHFDSRSDHIFFACWILPR